MTASAIAQGRGAPYNREGFTARARAMELHQIRYFLAVERLRSFTRAAETCNVTQPALTRAVRKLEDELGGPLVVREDRSNRLTPLGEAMLPLLRQTYSAAEAARREAEKMGRQTSNTLRLAVPPSMPSDVLVEPIAEVNRRYTGLELDLTRAEGERLVDQLIEGETEVAIVHEDDGLPDRLTRYPLFDERYVLICQADNPLADRDAVSINALDQEIWIERPYSGVSKAFQRACADLGIELKARHRASSDDQVLSMVRAGLGCALVSERMPLPEGVIARPIEGFDGTRTVLLVSVAGRCYTPASQAFVRIARARDWCPERESAEPD